MGQKREQKSGQTLWQRLLLRLQSLLESLWFLRFLPASLVYALKRDRTERRFSIPAVADAPTPAGALLQADPSDRGAVFQFERATLEVEFLAADLVRLSWQPGLLPIPYAIACRNWEPVAVTVKPPDSGPSGEWALASTALRLSVGPTGEISVWNDAGALLRQEEPPQWLGLSADETSEPSQNPGWIHRAPLPEETCIYGLGERIAGLNLRAAQDEQGRPKTFGFWNSDPGNIRKPGADPLYITMPVYLGLHTGGSYLVFYENSFNGTMQLGAQAVAQFEGGALRYYLAAGEPPQLLHRFTQLTGRAPLPPRWALGYHQSRWGYRTEEKVRSQVETFQAYDLPLSAVHLDIDCQVGHRAFTLDPERFPHLCQLTRTLAEAGVHLVAINNPGIKYSRHSNLFLEGQVLDAFCTYPDGELVVAPVWPGRTVFPDFTQPRVRAWWGYQFAYLIDVGIAGFWNDMNEPAAFASWGQQTLPRVARHAMEGRGGDHREAHNLYGLLEAKAAFESLAKHRPERRPFIVTRSGWVSMQRYAWTWTGDTLSTWTALRLTVGTVIGLGLSGVPFSGPDIGGFLGNPTAELYVRWFQMAAFMPFCRTHSSIVSDPRTPWTFGEPALSIVRDFLQLRYRLLPYLYTLAWEATRSGQPLVRPLFWRDQSNRALWDI
ncbi:MAG TPA: TIM-barrel domain-containing protein, partial [Trichocoleus sp.]